MDRSRLPVALAGTVLAGAVLWLAVASFGLPESLIELAIALVMAGVGGLAWLVIMARSGNGGGDGDPWRLE